MLVANLDNVLNIDSLPSLMAIRVADHCNLIQSAPGFGGMIPLYSILRKFGSTGYLDSKHAYDSLFALNQCLLALVETMPHELYAAKYLADVIDTMSIQIDVSVSHIDSHPEEAFEGGKVAVPGNFDIYLSEDSLSQMQRGYSPQSIDQMEASAIL